MPRLAQLDAALKRLDPEQKQVAAWTPADGNVRIVACAGSGKTESLAVLAARLVSDGDVKPESLVVTTYTRKAGMELRSRITPLISFTALQKMRIGTFHSLGLKELRAAEPGKWVHAQCLDADGRERSPHVPSMLTLWRCAVEWGKMPGTEAPSLNLDGAEAAEYNVAYGVVRGHGWNTPEDVPRSYRSQLPEAFIEAWQMVLDATTYCHGWDFHDVLAEWYTRLGERGPSAQVVLVDEAQDNTRIQIEIARRLGATIGLIGDLRQVVHVWRGAYPEIFAHADRDLGALTKNISTCYRSDPQIVTLANRIAAGRSWSLGEPAKPRPGRAPRKGAIRIQHDADPYSAAAREIQEMIEAREAKPADFALLARTNAECGEFQAALTELEIPCAVVGAKSIFDYRESDVFLSYAALSKLDAMNAFDKVMNQPKRYLPRTFAEQIRVKVKQQGRSIPAAISEVSEQMKPWQREKALDLGITILKLRKAKWAEVPEQILSIVGSDKTAKARADSPDEDRPALFRAMATIAAKFEDPIKLVEFASRCVSNVAVVTEGDDIPEARVLISTFHRMKGLQAKHVYVAASKGRFPGKKATDATMDEERRLLYVAVTRAVETLTLMHSDAGLSPLLKELGIETQEDL